MSGHLGALAGDSSYFSLNEENLNEMIILFFRDLWVKLYVVVRAKNEVGRQALTWAHNLFVMWVLDFLLWVVPKTETQQSNLSL